MPPTHTDEGLRAVIELRDQDPNLKVLIFSQYVETQYASRLLAHSSAGVGYLLKERVLDVKDFVDALDRVAAGGTALDPEVVSQLMGASRSHAAVDTLSPREREVLALMAQGRSNAAIAHELTVGERAVEKHVANIFTNSYYRSPQPTTAACSQCSATSAPDTRRRHRRSSGHPELPTTTADEDNDPSRRRVGKAEQARPAVRALPRATRAQADRMVDHGQVTPQRAVRLVTHRRDSLGFGVVGGRWFPVRT
jgi:DNA-binding NarL/FixJ family response regulator